MPASAIARTTSAAVTQLLRQSLDHGRWAGGEALRQEEIAAEFGVSRVPVREAQGLLHMVPNKGMYVRTMNADELRELFRLRWLIESDVLAQAVPLHSTATLVRLEAVQAALDKVHAAADCIAGDREFHEGLHAPAGRAESMAVVRRLRSQVDRFCFARTRPAERAQASEQHHALLRAARRRDASAATRVLQAHLAEGERRALASLRTR
jgi:DNA-binding GntR family transcriptional regulator